MQDGSTRPRRILQTRPRDVRGIPWVRRGFAGERYAGRRQKARPDPVASVASDCPSAIGQHLRIEPVHRLSDDFQVRGPVLAVAVDRLTPVATRSDVVDGAGKLDAQGAGHAGIVVG